MLFFMLLIFLIWLYFDYSLWSFDKELVQWQIEQLLTFEDPKRQHEGEQELVLLEDRLAHFADQPLREVANDVQQPVLVADRAGVRTRPELFFEDLDEPLERELVHVLDLLQVVHQKVHDGRPVCGGVVERLGLLDVLGRLVDLLQVLGDYLRLFSGCLQGLDHALVFEHFLDRRVQGVQDLLLELFEFFDQSICLLRLFDSVFFELGLFEGHDQREHLRLQPFKRDVEVYERNHQLHVRREVWVPKLTRHVKLEQWVDLDKMARQVYTLGVALSHILFLANRVKQQIELVADVLHEDWPSELDADLELFDKLALVVIQHD
mmetsp:Transcript_1490/g.1747  ORF Transcript_1490/g.1747 Transcript_1490/m.1747 type:complete len:321 (+) Transcript_1490:25-987(+)